MNLNNITSENFTESFNLKTILASSVFYPASGLDASPIEVFANKYNSFVHVDYSLSCDEVIEALKTNFSPIGYKLIGLKELKREELISDGNVSLNYTFNEHEKQRLVLEHVKEKVYGNNRFAVWAVYELYPALTHKTEGKTERFSILHIGGEACATFDVLYLGNKTNPKAIAIINPGEGYGDNWTKLSDSGFRFYQSIRKNEDKNDAKMPESILTNVGSDDWFFGEYSLKEKFEETKSFDYYLYEFQFDVRKGEK